MMMMVMVVVVGVITQGMDPCPSPVWGATGLVAYLHDLVTP